ncbi:hypothetical protein PV392_16330 [Streptomyces sp. ME03-5709C]|nr:hypothetical protein [Streptomyces sp. ME03-5709C]
MRVADLIAQLRRVVEEHGDLEVRAFDYAEITPDEVQAVELERDGQGTTYILLRP